MAKSKLSTGRLVLLTLTVYIEVIETESKRLVAVQHDKIFESTASMLPVVYRLKTFYVFSYFYQKWYRYVIGLAYRFSMIYFMFDKSPVWCNAI